ncbi:MAG: hypothetical protein SNG27_04430 [Rikenellaceae bacterium]
MKLKSILLSATLLSLSISLFAQTPLWQGRGRIAISSDGNEHDHDDWAATPLTLALIAARGVQDQIVLYTYSDHVWGSNQEHLNRHDMTAYEHMRESALGGAKRFGYDTSRFICAVDNAEVAYNAMRDVINCSTAEDPLIIIAAGPMQVVGEALNRSNIESRQFVTVVSHSNWNDRHADNPYMKTEWDRHTGWTFSEMREAFEQKSGGGVKFARIVDQNGGEGYLGLNAAFNHFDWIKDSPARNNPAYQEGSWDWLYGRIQTCVKKGKNYDPSDAGMVVYIFTGIEKTSPDMAREIMENPTDKDGKKIK